MHYRQRAIIVAIVLLLCGAFALLGYQVGQRYGDLQVVPGATPALAATSTPAIPSQSTAATEAPLLILPTAGPASIDIQPGMLVERTVGALSLAIRVDRQFAQVDIDVYLGGRLLAQRVLTQAISSTILELANGDISIHGSLAVRFAYPPGRSVLLGDFKLSAAQRELPFTGEIVAWPSPAGMLLARQVVWPTPELRVESDILFDTGSAVMVRLLTGTQTLATFTLSQDANSVDDARSYAIGTVQIAPNMQLHLQPATPTQNGQVTLIGTFASTNHPSVEYAGAIASWSYIAP